MNKNISALYSIAQKPSRYIIGLMSGTSLDGLDIALCRFQGKGFGTEIHLEKFETISYSNDTKQQIKKIFAKEQVDLKHLTLLNAWLGTYHGSVINSALKKWGVDNSQIDIIASHGQTIYHAPKIYDPNRSFGNGTLQIGDGDHIARETGIITISDFRQKHIAAGGEGAPLALYGDYFLFSKKNDNRLLLNMGGIANFTYLPGSLDPTTVLVTDTGPGNTLLDAYTQKYFNKDCDYNAELSLQGKFSAKLVSALKDHGFFALPIPKTTGPELFNLEYLQMALNKIDQPNLSNHDILASLTRFTVETIVDAIHQIAGDNSIDTVYLSGGGANNPLMVRWIKELLPQYIIARTDELQISADAKEAVLFAVLANETLLGEPIDFGRKGMPAVSMGKISFPG